MQKVLAAIKTIVDDITSGHIVAAVKLVLADAAKLQDPQLDASLLALVVAVVSPFGVNVGPTGPVVVGVLAAVGAIASIVQKVTQLKVQAALAGK